VPGGIGMLVLGIDTAGSLLSVAVVKDKDVLGEVSFHSGRNHAQRLTPMIDLILQETGVRKSELDGIAVNVGPGSFTGLRVGISTAKALAMALAIPLVGIDSFSLLKEGFKDIPGSFVCLLPARKNEAYWTVYRNGERIQDIRVGYREDILKEIDEEVYVVGPAREILAGRRLLGEPLSSWSALIVALLGTDKIEQGIREEVLPIYLRKSAAEEIWEERYGEKDILKRGG